MKLLVIDNVDSFVYNLVGATRALGADVTVVRNDAPLEETLKSVNPDALLLSPGPGHPKDSCLSLEILQKRVELPTLGVCLGLQAMGLAFGGSVVRAQVPLHGKTSRVTRAGLTPSPLFEGVADPFDAVRYHSLIIERATCPPELAVTAVTVASDATPGEIMAAQHKTLPYYGVQFHPESVLAQDGVKILKNFLEVAHR